MTKPRGICPECGANRALTKVGHLRSHYRAIRSKSGVFDGITTGTRCPGTDQPPRDTP